jgi:hypothetical protein
MLESLGVDKVEIYWNIDFNATKMGHGVPCSHRCIIIGCGVLLTHNITGKNDQPMVYFSRLFNSA